MTDGDVGDRNQKTSNIHRALRADVCPPPLDRHNRVPRGAPYDLVQPAAPGAKGGFYIADVISRPSRRLNTTQRPENKTNMYRW